MASCSLDSLKQLIKDSKEYLDQADLIYLNTILTPVQGVVSQENIDLARNEIFDAIQFRIEQDLKELESYKNYSDQLNVDIKGFNSELIKNQIKAIKQDINSQNIELTEDEISEQERQKQVTELKLKLHPTDPALLNKDRTEEQQRILDNRAKADKLGLTRWIMQALVYGKPDLAIKYVENIINPFENKELKKDIGDISAFVKDVITSFGSEVNAPEFKQFYKDNLPYSIIGETQEHPNSVLRAARGRSRIKNALEAINNNKSIFKFYDPFKNISTSIIKTIKNAFSTNKNKVLNRLDLNKFEKELFNNLSDKVTKLNKFVTFRMDESQFDLYGERAKKNPLIYLLKEIAPEQYDLEENIKSAVSLAMIKWLGIHGPSTVINSNDDIRQILGINDSDSILNDRYEILRDVGTPMSPIVDSLGNEIRRTLGLTINPSILESAPFMDDTLISSLGALAITAAAQAGLIEIHRVPSQALNDLRDPNNTDSKDFINTETDPTTLFISLKKVRDDKGNPILEDGLFKQSKANEGIIELVGNKNFESLYQKILGAEVDTLGPLLAPKPKPKYMKLQGTDQNASETAKEAIGILNSIEYGINTSVLNVLNIIGLDGYKEARGYIEDIDKNVHGFNKKTVEGKNLAIQQEYEKAMTFMEKLGDPNIGHYFTWNTWRQNRIGMIGRIINPQGNKLHRILSKPKSSKSTITKENLQLFKIAVMAGFGKEANKYTPQELEAMFDKLYASDLVQEMIKNPTKENIIKLFKEENEGAITFGSIAALLDYKPGKEFDTWITIETDSTTSGVAIAIMQYLQGIEVSEEVSEEHVTKNLSKLNAIGLHIDSEFTDQALWKQTVGNDDNYQAIARLVDGAMQDVSNDNRLVTLRSIVQSFIDENGQVTSAGRNFAKNPTTISAYGSGDQALKYKLSSNFIQKIYSDIEKAFTLATPQEIDQELSDIETRLNNMLTQSGKKIISIPRNKDKALNWYLNDVDLKNVTIRDIIGDTVYDEIASGLRSDSGTDRSIARRRIKDLLNITQRNLIIMDDMKLANMRQFSPGLDYMGLSELDNATFNAYEIIAGLMHATYGQGIVIGVNNRFDTELAVRTRINSIANAITHIYLKVRDSRIEEKKRVLGVKELTKKQIREVENEITAFLPKFRTVHSKNAEQEGILVTKTKSVYFESEEARGQITQPKKLTVFDHSYIAGQGASISTGELQNIVVPGKIDVADYPGVSAAVMMTQSVDGSAMQSNVVEQSNKGIKALAVHDAEDFAINDVEEGTQIANDVLGHIIDDYSIVEAVLERWNSITKPDKKGRILLEEYGFKLEDILNDFSEVINMVRDNRAKNAIEYISGVENLLNYFNNNINNTRKELKNREVTFHNYVFPNTAVKLNEPKEPITEKDVLKDVNEELTRDDDTFGSSEEDIKGFNPSTKFLLNGGTILDVFKGLATVGNKQESVNHSSYLEKMLEQIAVRVMDPLREIIVEIENQGNKTIGNITGDLLKIRAAIDPVFNALQMSAQEAYSHELAHAFTTTAIKENPILKASLIKIFDQVKAHFEAMGDAKYEEFLVKENGQVKIITDYDTELAEAKKRYEYIFNNKEGKNLEEFLAFGITNEHFMNLLSGIELNVKGKPQSVRERIANWFDTAMNWIGKLFYKHKRPKTADVALYTLAYELASTNVRHESKIRKITEKVDGLNPKVTRSINKYIWQPAVKYAYKGKVNPLKKAIMTVNNVPIAVNSAEFIYLHRAVRENIEKLTPGIIQSAFKLAVAIPIEMIGITKRNNAYYKAHRLSKAVDREVEGLNAAMMQNISNSFREPLTEEESKHLYMVMNTEMKDLLDTYSAEQLVKLLEDKEFLNKEINKFRNKLNQFGRNAEDYKNYTQALGYYMSTGKAGIGNLVKNAYNISRGLYDINGFEAEGDLDVAENIITKLRSLYAIQYAFSEDKKVTAEVIKREYKASPDFNGISNMFAQHREMKNVAFSKIFNSNPVLMEDGWTTEITNDKMDVQFSTDPKDKELLKKGYKLAEPLPQAVEDPFRSKKYMYIHPWNGQSTWYKGSISLIQENRKGTSLADLAQIQNSKAPLVDGRNGFLKIQKQPVNRKFDQHRVHLIPVLNEAGETVDYRYQMSEQSRIKHLEKDRRIHTVMGRMSGATINKVKSADMNSYMVDLIYKDYQDNFASNPGLFEELSAKNNSDLYHMLPYQMQQELKAKFNSKSFYIRTDMKDILFGYRIPSITNKDGFNIKGMRFAERLLMDIIGKAKQNVVIKNISTVYNNVMSNFFVGLMAGVPIDYMIKSKAEATVAMNEYLKDRNEYNKYKLLLNNPNLTKDQIQNYKNKMKYHSRSAKNNPVRELVEEGLFTSIIEDLNIEVEKDIYSIEHKFLEKFNKRGGKNIPKPLVNAYRYNYLTEDTPVYQLLYKTTQYSDFIARYSIYKWFTKEKGMSKDDAIEKVTEFFIQYDIPSSRELEYLNRIGVYNFTKYALRILKPMVKLAIEKPVSVVAMYLLNSATPWHLSTPYDSFNLPGVIPDTIGMAGSVLYSSPLEALEVLQGR